jgi:hypothetical protein
MNVARSKNHDRATLPRPPKSLAAGVSVRIASQYDQMANTNGVLVRPFGEIAAISS